MRTPDHISQQAQANAAELPPLGISAREAAKLLGVSTRTLWRLTSAGDVPFIRIGRRIVYPVRELEVWLSSRVKGGGR